MVDSKINKRTIMLNYIDEQLQHFDKEIHYIDDREEYVYKKALLHCADIVSKNGLIGVEYNAYDTSTTPQEDLALGEKSPEDIIISVYRKTSLIRSALSAAEDTVNYIHNILDQELPAATVNELRHILGELQARGTMSKSESQDNICAIEAHRAVLNVFLDAGGVIR